MISRKDNVHVGIEKISGIVGPLIGAYGGSTEGGLKGAAGGLVGGYAGGALGAIGGGLAVGAPVAALSGVKMKDLKALKDAYKLEKSTGKQVRLPKGVNVKGLLKGTLGAVGGAAVGSALGSYYGGKAVGKLIGGKKKSKKGIEKVSARRPLMLARHSGMRQGDVASDPREDIMTGINRIKSGQTMKELGSVGMIGSLPISLIKNTVAQKAGRAGLAAGSLGYVGGYLTGKSGENKIRKARRKLSGVR